MSSTSVAFNSNNISSQPIVSDVVEIPNGSLTSIEQQSLVEQNIPVSGSQGNSPTIQTSEDLEPVISPIVSQGESVLPNIQVPTLNNMAQSTEMPDINLPKTEDHISPIGSFSLPETVGIDNTSVGGTSIEQDVLSAVAPSISSGMQADISTDNILQNEGILNYKEVQSNDNKNNISKSYLTPEEKDKRFNKLINILILIVSLIAILSTSYLIFKMITSEKDQDSKGKNLTTQHNYEGIKFLIPENIVSSVEDGNFIIKNLENTWSAVITIQDGSYSTLVSNKAQISNYFENFGYISGEVEEKEVSGISFIVTEVVMGEQNVLVACAKASGTKIYGVIYTNEDGTYDNNSLDIVGKILATSTNDGYDSSMPEGFTYDMFKKMFELAK